jgi:glycerophosphoryl diester phosphodiesterase
MGQDQAGPTSPLKTDFGIRRHIVRVGLIEANAYRQGRSMAQSSPSLTSDDTDSDKFRWTPVSSMKDRNVRRLDGSSGAQPPAGISNLPHPFFFAHRGGAGIAPENSMDAFLQALAVGVDGIEAGDLQHLSDGGIGAMHDASVDRTTTGSGSPSSYSTAGWRDLVLDSSVWFGSGWGDVGAPPLLGAILSRLGGKTVLALEVKDQSPVTAAAVCAAVNDAGLVDSVLVQCFDFTTCEAIAAAGCHTVYLMVSGAERDPTAIRSAGIEWVALHTSVAPSAVQTLKAGGLGVLIFTDDDQKQVASWWATGHVDGFFTDQPSYAAGQFNGYKYRTGTAPWVTEGRRSHGMNDIYTNNYASLRAKVVGTAGAYRFQPAAKHLSAILQGWGCPLADARATYRITIPITFDSLDGDSTSWAGSYFGMTDDTTGMQDADIVGPTGWLAVIQQGGQMALYKSDGSAYAPQSAAGSAAVTAGSTVKLVIDVTPTTITVSRQDYAPATLSAALAPAVAVASLPVIAISAPILSGTCLLLPTGQVATTTAAVQTGGTSIPVEDFTPTSIIEAGGAGHIAMHRTDAAHRGAYFHLRNKGKSAVGIYSWGAVTVS